MWITVIGQHSALIEHFALWWFYSTLVSSDANLVSCYICHEAVVSYFTNSAYIEK